MSQHDNIIENQAGASFRADVNAALQAQASNQSGSAEPTTTYPYQFWADTGSGVLKMRNAANTAWIKLGLLGASNFGLILPGDIVFHAKNTAPSGFLKANGAAVSRTTYADLFAEIGTTFGAGDGSTTFTLPDLRGEFLRGWDDGRGVDAARAFGSAQANQMTGHQHTLPFAFDAGSFYSLAGSTPATLPIFGAASVSAYYKTMINNGPTAGPISVAAGITSGVTLSDAAETRPRNVALLACIKY